MNSISRRGNEGNRATSISKRHAFWKVLCLFLQSSPNSMYFFGIKRWIRLQKTLNFAILIFFSAQLTDIHIGTPSILKIFLSQQFETQFRLTNSFHVSLPSSYGNHYSIYYLWLWLPKGPHICFAVPALFQPNVFKVILLKTVIFTTIMHHIYLSASLFLEVYCLHISSIVNKNAIPLVHMSV